MFQFLRFGDPGDFDLYASLVFDPAVMNRNLGRVFTEEEAAFFYRMILSPECSQDGFGYFKVMLSETNTFIGICAIQKNEKYQAPEIEYMLLPVFWNQGYGTALVQQLLIRAKELTGRSNAVAITDPDNVYSRKILLKCGFRSEKIYSNPDGEPAELFLKAEG